MSSVSQKHKVVLWRNFPRTQVNLFTSEKAQYANFFEANKFTCALSSFTSIYITI